MEQMSLTELQIFKPGFFVPEYRPMQSGAWEVRQTANVLCQGYWSKAQLVPSIAALLRDDNVWMSITPMELESQAIGIEQASGHVVIFGLGMGWAAAATSLRELVTKVTVVEYDPEVIALHRELDIFSQLPALAQSKIRIEQGDAYAWRPAAPVDLLMPDIWLPLVSDGRVAEVQQMQANVGAAAVYFWGQELEIARHCRAAGRPLDAQGIATGISAFGLPLIGPVMPDYAQRVATVAERWMGNRWLSEVA
jgi:hypothetical protein